VIFVDANVYVRHLVQPATRFDVVMAAQAAALFGRAERAEITITTSEATIAEVVFILSARTHYNAARSTVCAGLRPLLAMRACRLPTKTICIRALDVWEAHPKLSYPDALSAVYSELRNYQLATYDERLRTLPTVNLYDLRQQAD
jgi:predicted nucleic acid-binding protein